MGRAELVLEAEDAVRVGFGGVEVVFGEFEGSKFFNGEVLWKVFDREAGKIIEHSMGFWRSTWRVFMYAGGVAD